MSQLNVTVDDFDPVVSYSNYEDWQTPNPQDHPDWWNATQEVTGSQWHEATYHYTTVQGAQASFNFTGTGLWVYGATGSTSNYTITLDPKAAQPFTQSFSTANATEGRTLLYGADNLAYAEHEVVIVNQGNGLLLDLFVTQVEIGAEGATVTNTTLDDRSPDIKFTGDWTQQTGPNFFNQTSTYTGGLGNYFEVDFEGSAIWIYGDQVNDHGEFTVSINGTDVATNNGRSGCGGGYAKACEKLHGLSFFTGGLPAGKHTLRLTNNGPSEGNKTFYDFDYLQYATPSAYSTKTVAASSCPFATCEGGNSTTNSNGTAASGTSGTASSTGSQPATTSGNDAGRSVASGTGALAMVLGAWVLRKLL